MHDLLQYIPTAVVALIIGLGAQWVVRKGKKDENVIQGAANEAHDRIAQTEQAIGALTLVNERLEAELKREHEWRIDCEDRNRMLNAIVVGQIEVTSKTAFPEDT